jgi:RNA polymerase sigma-70 factor (ECF subfamily)
VETVLTRALNTVAEEQAEGISSQQFDAIIRQHQRRVYRVIFLLVKDADAADTLAQECFLRAYQKRASFRGECRIETWILRIAVNLARDHGKSRRMSFWRKLAGLEESGPREIAAPQPSAERALLAREELQAVWGAVNSLSPQQQTVFLLRFAEEMSLAEIAGVMGLKIGSVKAQLFRAIGRLRQQMKENQWR